VEKKREIVWESSALDSINKALIWISEKSIQGAETVETGINKKLHQASINPYRFPPDEFKIGNTGNFRSFVSHSYRISYKVNEKEIRVLRTRHVKQKPTNY
jgi:plasmid stabilization system protein ParE